MNVRLKEQHGRERTMLIAEAKYILQYYAIKLGKDIEVDDTNRNVTTSTLNLNENVVTIHRRSYSEIGDWQSHQLNIVSIPKREFSIRQNSYILKKPHPKIQEIVDNRGIKIAYVVYNNIFIPFNVEKSSILQYIVEKAMPLLNFNIIEIKELQMEQQRNNYYTLLNKGVEDRKRNLQELINRAKTRVDDINNTLQTEVTNLYNKIEELDTWSNSSSTILKEKAAKDFDRMKMMISSKMFSYIKFETNRCVAETNECYITYKSKKYFVGKFVITIQVNDGTIYVDNLNYSHAKYPNIHPHMSGTNMCYGNISKNISTMSAKKEYLSLLQLFYRYLNSYNHSDAYVKFDTSRWVWKEVKKKK